MSHHSDPAARSWDEAVDRRSFLAGASAFGLTIGAPLVVSGAAAGTGGKTTQKRDLVVLQRSDITALDPHAGMHTSDIAVKGSLFDTLVRRHPDGTLHPALSTAWKRTAAATWQFTIRADVRWHDGTRFTSVDAKYSLDRTYDATLKAARLSPFFGTIDRTEAPDPGTLVVHTKRPDSLIPAKLAYCGQMVPWAYIDRVGITVFNRRPVGTGPLRFVSWTKGEACVLAANPDYWDGRLDLDRVVFRPVPEPGARVDALLRGDADLITRLTPDHAERVAAHPSTRVAGALYAGLYVLLVNVWVAPLNDPLVRQALSLAIDREAIVKDIWRGRGVVPSGPIPRGDTHYDPARPPLAYDPQGARKRLRQAGYRGEPVVLETTAGFIANDKAMTELIAEMWEDIGVKVIVDVIDNDVRRLKYRQQTFKGLAWSDPTSTTGDPDGMMGRLLGPDTPHDYWRHPEFDRLVIAARMARDESVRADAYRRMTAIFLEHNPWIVVLQPYEDCGFRRYVEFTPSPDQQLELRRFNFRMRRN
ncbi:MAG: ABC transporter substrate-binding protein [Gemmatimonadota bacterium]